MKERVDTSFIARSETRRLALDAKALGGRRDVKVKLPSEQVLRLYYLKLTTSLTYSDVIEDALARYFASLDEAAARQAASD